MDEITILGVYDHWVVKGMGKKIVIFTMNLCSF